MDDPKPKPPAHIPPKDRSRIEVSKSLARLFHGAPQQKAPLSYYSPILIQCTLPHSDPQTRDWVKTNGNVSLIISSGVDEELKPYGVPYGSFPRLVLAYIITQVIQTGERRVELTSHFGSFLKEIGYTSNHKGAGLKGQRVRDQLIRLLRASITFQDKGNGHLSVQDVKIAPKFDLWFDPKNPEEDSLWESSITISEEFRESILRSPVPLRTDILAALKKSPLALDVYMWVSYRLFAMQAADQSEISLSYGQLQTQFGTGIAEENYRLFRSRFKQALAEVAQYWRAPDSEKILLNYDLTETRLVLYRSPLLVSKPRPSGQSADAQSVLRSKTFDAETRRQARQLAGNWSLEFLTSQYFEWIESEDITPNNPSAHFLNFVRRHRQRNGEAL
jgi:Plasmid encoded RepA protein